uniref:Unconventional prefoldin RPB5 interactor 1 n=1 Tax=Panagrellus redivivus TaxID=6233 RepID=A0A7E4V0K3_PANRE
MEKPTGTVRHIGQLDDVMKANFERLRQHANAEIAKCDEAIALQKAHIDQLNTDIRKIRSLPQKLRHDEWLPVNGCAFVRGTLDNTNKFLTMLGSEYFAERSATETVAFLERKITAAKDTIEKLGKQRGAAVSRVSFAEMFEDTEDMVEIQEPFCPEALKTGTTDAPEVSKDDFEDMMKRLDELEKQEEDNGELAEESGEKSVDAIEEVETDGVQRVESAKLDAPKKVSQPESTKMAAPNGIPKPEPAKLIAPKGVSQADFDALLKKVDELVASSDSESDYEGEDDSADEEELDSDDSLPPTTEHALNTVPVPATTSSPPIPNPNPQRRRSVAFAPTLERGPSPVPAPEEASPAPTKSILRNKDVKTPVNEAAVRAMDESDVKQKKILPATDAFRGTFIEHDPMNLGPSTSTAVIEPLPTPKKPVSRFKQQRKGPSS